MLAAIQRSRATHALGIALLYVACALTQSASAQSAGEIRVIAAHGDANVQMGGVTAPLSANAVLQLPATIRTGADGAVELRQGPTTIAVAGHTELLIPESAAVDGLIERVVQISGNAFYNVGKRETHKLRVETPHLVAIIKGTQFNVAAQPDTTTIALYEGLLEVQAADDSDVVELHPGEIAIRRRDDVSIRVLRTATAAIAVPRTSAPVAASADARAAQSDVAPDVTRAVAPIEANPVSSSDDSAGVQLAAQTTIAEAVMNPADLSDTPQDVAPGLDASVGPDSVAAVVDVDVGLDAGPIDTSIGASVGLTGGSVDIGADVGLDAGTVTADIGASVGVGAGAVDVGLDVGAGAGPVTADLGLSAGVGGDVIGVGADVGVGAGDIGVDVGADVDALGGAAAVTADVDLGAAGNVNADVGVNLQSPEITVDTQVGGLVGADVGLGADGPSIDVEVGGSGAVGAVGDVVEDVVGAVDDILGGLLRRRPRQ